MPGLRDRLILNFHGLGPSPDWIVSSERPYWCQPDRFISMLDSIPDVSQRFGIRIEITFDDGNTSDVTIALPALAARGLSAVFFICAGRIGRPGYLDAHAMNDLVAAGMRVGSHGWAHVDWRRTDDDVLDHEVNDSRSAIADAIGRPVDEVAIPFGSYDRRVIRHLRRTGVHTVYTSDGGKAPLVGWLVPRETYTASWGPDSLQAIADRRLSSVESVRQSMVRTLKRLR